MNYRGVKWNREEAAWMAFIKTRDQFFLIGYYATSLEAAHAYNEAAKERFGKFATLNIVE